MGIIIERKQKIMFEFALGLAIKQLEKAIEKRKEKGKANRFLKKAFSAATQEKVQMFTEIYFTAAIELEDELEEND